VPVARRDDGPLGVVYTPADTARAMVEIALGPLVSGKSAEELLALRICDPAVGEGAFLVEVVERLARGLAAHGWPIEAARRAVREQCVCGVDIDARAVERARLALGNPVDRVRVGDALAIDWRATFGIDRFDVVIGNPPYIRQEHLDKTGLETFEVFDGVADLYVYFLELAHRIGRRYCLITPNKWLTVAYARPLRAFLAKQNSVEGIVDLAAERVFREDAFPCVVWGSIDRPGRPGRPEAVRGSLAAKRIPHDRARWTDEPWHIDEPADRALIDELEQRWPALGTILPRPARGIVTGANDVFVIDRETRDRLIEEDATSATLIRPFVKGRDLRRWRAHHAERYIVLVDRGTDVDAHPAIARYLAAFRARLEPGSGRKPGKYRWCELQDPVGEHSASRAPRLFLQDIQTEPTCCLDETGLVADTTVWILPTSDRFLLALLSSSLYGWYAQRRFPPALNGAVRPKLDYLRALPVATSSPAIAALVDAQLAEPTTERDRAIDDAILDAYQLTSAQRAVVARSASRPRSAARHRPH
jgi:hypothetical protein